MYLRSIVIILAVTFPCNGDKVITFSASYMKALGTTFLTIFFESDMPSVCQNMPDAALDDVWWHKGIGVNDCIAIYDDEDCRGMFIKIQYKGVGTLYHPITNFSAPKSLISCAQMPPVYTGPKPISLYTGESRTGRALHILDSARCMVLPNNFLNPGSIGSVYTHGLCFEFHQDDCFVPDHALQPPVLIVNNGMFDVGNITFAAIRPCSSSVTPVQLHYVLHRIELHKPEKTLRDSVKNVEMAAKITIINNGSATLTQEYVASRKITESVEVSISKSKSFVYSHDFSNEFSMEASTGFNAFGFDMSVKVSNTFRYAYSKSAGEESGNSATQRNETEKQFSVSQKIEVPACTSYEITSYVAMTEDASIKYTVYSRVTGTRGREQLRTTDFRNRMGDLEMDDDYDTYTAIVKTHGLLKASYGVEALIDGIGTPIPDCLVHHSVRNEQIQSLS